MRRVVIVTIVLVLICLSAHTVETESTSDRGGEEIRNDSFAVNPLGFLAGLLLYGGVDIGMEYQHAFSPAFTLIVMPEVVFLDDAFGLVAGIGVNIFPMSRWLHGFFIGLIPIGGFVTAYGFVLPIYGAYARVGFQWVFDSGFQLAVGGGGKWDNYFGIGPHIMLTLGYAW